MYEPIVVYPEMTVISFIKTIVLVYLSFNEFHESGKLCCNCQILIFNDEYKKKDIWHYMSASQYKSGEYFIQP